jgi:alanyl-tRNA synthetase
MTPEQIREVERIVREKISEALPVERVTLNKDVAESIGAEHEFGAKYPDVVSVYFVGPTVESDPHARAKTAFSIEFCGGPHVDNTSELIGEFSIQKEEAVAAGIRRIKATLA